MTRKKPTNRNAPLEIPADLAELNITVKEAASLVANRVEVAELQSQMDTHKYRELYDGLAELDNLRARINALMSEEKELFACLKRSKR